MINDVNYTICEKKNEKDTNRDSYTSFLENAK